MVCPCCDAAVFKACTLLRDCVMPPPDATGCTDDFDVVDLGRHRPLRFMRAATKFDVDFG
jgi:hypothetical protein